MEKFHREEMGDPEHWGKHKLWITLSCVNERINGFRYTEDVEKTIKF